MGQNSRLERVKRLVDRGFPASALLLADALGVQFNLNTLRRWLREEDSFRKTYAAVYTMQSFGTKRPFDLPSEWFVKVESEDGEVEFVYLGTPLGEEKPRARRSR